MANSFICNTAKNVIGRTTFNLNASKCPKFKIGDVLFLSNPDRLIHSRWEVKKVGEKLVEIVKEPAVSVSVSQDDLFSSVYTKKYDKLSEKDAKSANSHFIHNIKVFPSFDYKSKNDETNRVLSSIKEFDPKMELYVDAVRNNDSINGLLDGSYSVLIINDYGVISFKCVEEDLLSAEGDLQKRFSNQLKNDDIRDLLKNSKQLTDDKNHLMINNVNVIIFETDNVYEMSRLNGNLAMGGSHVRVFTCGSFIEYIKNLDRDQRLTEMKRVGIIQSLLPQYINSKTVDIVGEKLKFTESDDVFELDDVQKETLQALNQRSFIKASAGSGKTILLLAKAYEVAAANPNEKFLLLCFNNKLAEDIQNQANNTGRNRANLRICTLDKFLKDEKIPVSNNYGVQAFDERKKAFVELVLGGKINYGYGGIFVDEVQQMKDDWLCALLQCTDEQKYMVVSGDYYQSINPGLIEEDDDDDFIEDGDTSNYTIGGYEFETIVLDKNYRNTKSIAKVLSRMTSNIHTIANELDIPNKEEKVQGKAYKEGVITPCYYKSKQGDAERELILQKVDYLVSKLGCSPGDILLICPLANSFKNSLYSKLIEKYNVCDFTGKNYGRISTGGIKMGTIGKSIGLDFKAVIVFSTCDLVDFMKKKPVNYIDDMSVMKQQSKNVKKQFLAALKNLYVACSRAREALIVIDDSETDNVFTDFIIKSGLEDKTNE